MTFEPLDEPWDEPACEVCGGVLWYGRGGARLGVCGSCWADHEADEPQEEDRCDD